MILQRDFSLRNREDRLQRRREWDRACRVSETTEQREARLRIWRATDRIRRAAETDEQRLARLQRMGDWLQKHTYYIMILLYCTLSTITACNNLAIQTSLWPWDHSTIKRKNHVHTSCAHSCPTMPGICLVNCTLTYWWSVGQNVEINIHSLEYWGSLAQITYYISLLWCWIS